MSYNITITVPVLGRQYIKENIKTEIKNIPTTLRYEYNPETHRGRPIPTYTTIEITNKLPYNIQATIHITVIDKTGRKDTATIKIVDWENKTHTATATDRPTTVTLTLEVERESTQRKTIAVLAQPDTERGIYSTQIQIDITALITRIDHAPAYIEILHRQATVNIETVLPPPPVELTIKPHIDRIYTDILYMAEIQAINKANYTYRGTIKLTLQAPQGSRLLLKIGNKLHELTPTKTIKITGITLTPNKPTTIATAVEALLPPETRTATYIIKAETE